MDIYIELKVKMHWRFDIFRLFLDKTIEYFGRSLKIFSIRNIDQDIILFLSLQYYIYAEFSLEKGTWM